MGYLSNNTRVSSLTIAGTDYTSNFVSWTVSDASANKNGCISTTGNLKLATKPGGVLIEDYDRNNFKRGDQVILELTEPGGSAYRHPRGLLYVIATSYNVESEELDISLGCRLALIALTDDIDDLQAIVPVPLDVAQSSYQNCCASFASVGQYVYQDNQGSLETGVFFDGDTFQATAAGEWVSVLGVTTNSVSPLAGTSAIPDQIKLSYQVPSDSLAEDNKGQVDIVTTESYYFISYPVVNYVRQNTDADEDNPNGTLGNAGGTSTPAYESTSNSSSCGNTPDQPTDNGTPSCNEGYILEQAPLFLPAYRIATQTTTYDGPGAQVSTVRTETRGPRVESNQQYFADSFAYCRQTWGTACQPNGGCPFLGMDEMLLGYSETINYYGEANELVRTITDNYTTELSAAQPSDWRAGNTGGKVQSFDNTYLTSNTLYRQRRTDTRYSVEGNVNVQTTDTYTSMTSRGVGITGGQSIDALNGIKTTEVRKSSTISTLDVAPDIINSATTSTKEKSETLVLFTGRFTTPPAETGPYELEEQIPVPLLFETDSEINNAVANYSNYLSRFVKGDAFGLQVGESMRSDVAANWRPGMPFRYYDSKKVKVVAMRMDSTVWGVDTKQAAFVTNGIWNGFSNGNVTIPSNLVGNSAPDMADKVLGPDGTDVPAYTPSPTPPPAVVPPSVEGETFVDNGTLTFVVDVNLMFQSLAETFAVDGVSPAPPELETVSAYCTTTCYVAGIVVETGDLLETDSSGGIPLELNGSLVVADATVVTADLFA